MNDTVVARYSSPATAALCCLILPYLFPELSTFATNEDLVTHLRTSNARYRAEFLDRNPPPMYITLYFIVTRLPDSLRAVRDHFLALDPTNLTVDLLEKHLAPAETSVVAVGAARGTPRTPFFEGCSPSPLAPSYASAAAVDILGAEDIGAASTLSGKRRSSKGKGGRGGGGGSGGGGGGGSGGGGGGGGGGSGGSGGGRGGFSGGRGGSGGGGGGGGSGSGGGGSGGGRGGAVQRGGYGGGQRQQQQRRSETLSPQQLLEWFAWRGASGGSVRCPYILVTRLSAPAGQCCLGLDYDAILVAVYALSISAEGECYLCVPPDPGIEAAALGASESALLGTAPAEALHTFMLDSVAPRCFFRDSTTLTPLPAPVPVRLADPSGGPVLARSSIVLPCPAVLSGSLSGLHLPLFSTKLVSTAALQDALVTTTTSGGQRVSICTCTRTGRHLATFTRRPGSSPYTLTTEPPQVAASAQVSASPAALAYPALPSLRRGAASRRSSLLLVSSNECSLAESPHGCVGPSPCQWTGPQALISTVRLQLRERFREDLPVLCLHSDRGGEFSSDLSRDFCRGEGILQSFTLPASPQKNGVAEHRISLVMEVACTSMIHAAGPHFLWSFAVRYDAHQLNLRPRVSESETSPTLWWTGKVGDASVFWFWGALSLVRDAKASKLSSRTPHCIFLGFPTDAPPWQFYHLRLRRVFFSEDVTFDESVLDPLPPQGLAPSGVSQVDSPLLVEPLAISSDSSGPAKGGDLAADNTAATRHSPCLETPPGFPPRPSSPPPQLAAVESGAETAGAEPGGAETEGEGFAGAVTGGADSWGAATGGPVSPSGGGAVGDPAGGPGVGQPLQPDLVETHSPQMIRAWIVRRGSPDGGWYGPAGAGAASPGGTW
ncbi:unnamed protein product [Closterium sp. NIES-54]